MSAGTAPAGVRRDAIVDAPARRTVSPRLDHAALWLLGFGGAISFFEPSPYEFAFVLCLSLLAAGGLRVHRSTLPLVVLMGLFNLGGVFSLAPFVHDEEAVRFIAISVYLMVTTIFFAAVVIDRGAQRFAALRGGLTWGAAVAATAGVMGYFDVAGLSGAFTLHDRASGTFKDPNVLGAFVILPVVLLAQDMLTGRGRFLRKAALVALLLGGGVFLSFSRGAWGHAVASLVMMIGLTLLLTATARVRLRVLGFVALAPVIAAAGLAAALSVEEVRSMFELRASLGQSYDVGPQGRFGSQLRSLPELLQLPNGYGPLQFRDHWPEDPHNVYINAFASYGWLGGMSYLAMTLATVAIGFATVATRFSLQPLAIAVWSVLFVQMLQGFTIDTDHWRHYWLMLGLIWGLFACSRLETRGPAPRAR